MENTTQQPQKPANKTSISPGQTFLQGKIVRARKHESRYYTVIMSPGRDEYSYPSAYELRSNNQLGQEGDLIKVIVEVSGTVKRFSYIDQKTGLQKTGDKSSVFLDVIE